MMNKHKFPAGVRLLFTIAKCRSEGPDWKPIKLCESGLGLSVELGPASEEGRAIPTSILQVHCLSSSD